MQSMIFHVPFKIDADIISGTHIRPRHMIEAFRRIGLNVEVVEGSVRDRRRKIRELKNRINKGEAFSFAYSESSTMPTALTEKHHLPIAPFLDFTFLAFLRRKGIHTGLFYRDVHWLFEQYVSSTSLPKRVIAKLFYRYDLFWYKLVIKRLYLPCLSMAGVIFLPTNRLYRCVGELPPGAGHEGQKQREVSPSATSKQPLRLIYVGGMGTLYDITTIVRVVAQVEGLFLTLSTRKREWERHKHEYRQFNGNYRVVFHSGEELRADYFNSDIAVLFVAPVAYWKIAMPVKLFEYMSMLLPVIGVQGTAAGNFISKNDIGWSIPYDINSVEELLRRIRDRPEEIHQKAQNIKRIINDHTWEARARKVVMELSQ